MNPEDIGAYYESILDKEVRKAGGVYYTPPPIVNYMVENTLCEFLKNKTPAESTELNHHRQSAGTCEGFARKDTRTKRRSRKVGSMATGTEFVATGRSDSRRLSAATQ